MNIKDLTSKESLFIYCSSSKTALMNRKESYINSFIKGYVEKWKNNSYVMNAQYNELIDSLAYVSKQTMVDNEWKDTDIDGVTWFIGNFIDILIRTRKEFDGKYDELFYATFIKYYGDREKTPDELLLISYYVVSQLIDKYDYEDRDSLVSMEQIKSILSDKYYLVATEQNFLTSIDTLNKLINSTAIEVKYLQDNFYVPIKELHFYTSLNVDYLKNAIFEGIKIELNKKKML